MKDNENPEPLNSDQLNQLRQCIDWYTDAVQSATRHFSDIPEIVAVGNLYIVRLKESKHVYGPSAWLQYRYKKYCRALGVIWAVDSMDSLRNTST